MARNKYDVDEDLEVQFNMEYCRRMGRYIVKYKKEMIMTLIIMLLSSVIGLFGPYLVKVAMDTSIPNKDFKSLSIVTGLFVLTVVLGFFCMRYRIKTMTYVGQNVVKDMRSDFFRHLQRLPFSYYDERPHGKILVRVVNYVNELSDLMSNGLVSLVTDTFSIFVILGFMLFINVKLTLVCLCGLPVLILVIASLKKVQRRTSQIYSNKSSNLNAYIQESISGMKVTQAFVREDENAEKFARVSGEVRDSWMTAILYQKLLWPAIDNISVITASAVYLIGISAIGESITVGTLVAFVAYIWRFWNPVVNISNFYNTLIMDMAYLERIFETIDEPIAIDNAEDAYKMPKITGRVEFDDVDFCYDDDD